MAHSTIPFTICHLPFTILREEDLMPRLRFGVACLAFLTIACGSFDRSGPRRSTKASFYIHADFVGSSQQVNSDVADLGNVEGPCVTGSDESATATWDDCISSMRVLPGWRATLYRDPNFRGASIEVAEDLHDFKQIRGRAAAASTTARRRFGWRAADYRLSGAASGVSADSRASPSRRFFISSSRPPSLNATSSISWLMRKMPRPLGFITFSGASGLATSGGVETGTGIADDNHRLAAVFDGDDALKVTGRIAAAAVTNGVGERLLQRQLHLHHFPLVPVLLLQHVRDAIGDGVDRARIGPGSPC